MGQLLSPALANLGVGPDGHPVGVVDWIEVQLRIVSTGTDAPATAAGLAADKIHYKAGLLLSDGLIVDADTVSELDPSDVTYAEAGLSFEGVTLDPEEVLYALVNHRNHLPIMSAIPLSIDDDAYVYDFSDPREF